MIYLNSRKNTVCDDFCSFIQAFVLVSTFRNKQEIFLVPECRNRSTHENGDEDKYHYTNISTIR
jgi:hypothetical protein